MKRRKLILLIWTFALLSCKYERPSEIIFLTNYSIDTLAFASTPDSDIILLEAMVQGKQYKLAFDTGSPTTLVSSIVPSLKTSSDTVFFNDIINQPHASVKVSIDTLRLGRLQVINKQSYTQRDLTIDGILGNDIIGHLVWKIDFVNQKVYLTQDVKNFNVLGDGIPLTKIGPYITMKCSISNKELDLIIDTGYSGFISMNKNLADSLLYYSKRPILWEGVSTLGRGNPYLSPSFTEHIDTTYYFYDDISFGKVTLKNEIIELRHFPWSIVGMDFFKRFEYFIIDYPNQKLYFGKVQRKSLDFLVSSLLRMNTKGVTLIPSDSKAIVGKVTSSGKEVGIHYLDTVLSIDGVSIVNRDSSFYQSKTIQHEEISYVEYFPSEFRKLWTDFHFKSDTSTIEIKRGNNSQFYTLYREYNFTAMPDSLHDYYVDLSLPLPNFNKVKTDSDSYYFRFKTEELVPWGLLNKPERHITMAPEKP
jgi:hypothetical protein